VERELLITGVGGQGVQLAARVAAGAAALEGREVSLFGLYGGSMRGGNTDAMLVVGDAPIESPPIVSRAWSAVALHHQGFPAVGRRLRPGAVVVLNSTLFEGSADATLHRVFEIPASHIASGLGSPVAAAMVAIGAYAAITGLVGVDALVKAMEESLPPYRRQSAPGNAKALRAGYEAAPRGAAPAWEARG
jgi:Pyruvate/2-oxoacid:ferredoxin oxidoreductase gamma subunit